MVVVFWASIPVEVTEVKTYFSPSIIPYNVIAEKSSSLCILHTARGTQKADLIRSLVSGVYFSYIRASNWTECILHIYI